VSREFLGDHRTSMTKFGTHLYNTPLSVTQERMRSSSSGVRDLIELKLQKKLLQEQLHHIDNKTSQIHNLLEKKKNDPRSSLYQRRENPPPEMSTMVLGHVTLNELRPILRSSKVVAKPPSVPLSDLEPSPIPFGSNLERIRQEHIKRTVGKQEVMRLTKVKTEIEEKKARRNGMKHAGPKIPDSMFPNRYLRGELPCTIEHGVRGICCFSLLHVWLMCPSSQDCI
jgi:hypothetical protein